MPELQLQLFPARKLKEKNVFKAKSVTGRRRRRSRSSEGGKGGIVQSYCVNEVDVERDRATQAKEEQKWQ